MRIVTPEALATVLGSLPENPRIVATGNHAAPREMLGILDRSIETFRLFTLNAQPGTPDREGITLESCFVGPAMRKSPRLKYYPLRLSLAPFMFGQTLVPDVAVIHCTTPLDGMVSLGVETNIMPAAIEAVRDRGGLVIAQMNTRMPYTFGDSQVPVDYIDYAIEVDEPLLAAKPSDIDAISAAIGRSVAERIPNGATLQLGIGNVPDAAVAELTRHTDLRVWTEMFSDGVMKLDQAGCMDQDTPITASFLFGSDELYAWVDKNPRVRILRTEKTNDPSNIARQRIMMSINTALQVDLLAQANASRIKTRIYSGFGGSTDFIVGALHSPGGQAIMALRSWHPKADVSTIVPVLQEPTTSFQPSWVITEHGAARIFGSDEKTQARNIIEEAAHPQVRAQLWDAARAMSLA